jgi:acetylornithine deacetylase/succinyl-diaminopimelate desuccinylase-like protein
MAVNKISKSNNYLTRRTFVETGAAGVAAWSLAHTQLLNSTELGLITAKEALQMARQRRTDLVDLLSQLISMRSQASGNAATAQEVVKEFLTKLPYHVDISSDKPSQFAEHTEFMPPDPPGDGPFVNIIGRPHHSPGANLALFAHIDTHIVENGWKTDPYQAVIDNGRLYGLGSADDKGGVAAMLIAAAALSNAGSHAPIVISHHAKGGGSRGSLQVFENLKNSGEKIDAVLYSHPAETGHGLNEIKNNSSGVLDVILITKGWRGQPLDIGLPDSALWTDGGNALEVCWKAVNHLKNGVLQGLRVNIGKLKAGNRTGSVPDQARAEIRILFDGDHTWQELLNLMQNELDSFSDTLPRGNGTFRNSIEAKGLLANPGTVAWDHPSCNILRRAIEEIKGIAPVSYPNHLASDIRHPIRTLGVPAFGIGSLGGNFYGPNEWVDIDDLVNLVAVIILTMSGWSST